MKKIEALTSSKEAVLVVYCSSFGCQLSPRAASTLVGAGYTNVYDFKGGLADWQDAGYQFEGEAAKGKVSAKCSCCK